MTSNGSAPSPLSILVAIRSTNSSTLGVCTEGGVPVSAPQPAVVPVQLDRGVGGLRAQHDDRPLRPVARVVEAEHLGRVFDQLPDPGRGRVLLLATLVVGDKEREQVVSDAQRGRLWGDTRLRVARFLAKFWLGFCVWRWRPGSRRLGRPARARPRRDGATGWGRGCGSSPRLRLCNRVPTAAQ
jgi:hypothetical protein